MPTLAQILAYSEYETRYSSGFIVLVEPRSFYVLGNTIMNIRENRTRKYGSQVSNLSHNYSGPITLRKEFLYFNLHKSCEP